MCRMFSCRKEVNLWTSVHFKETVSPKDRGLERAQVWVCLEFKLKAQAFLEIHGKM